jgi:hypothetical protein
VEQELGPEVRTVLDEINTAFPQAPAPTDMGSAYFEARPLLERLVSALNASGGEASRVGHVIDNLMARADSVTGMAAGVGQRTL